MTKDDLIDRLKSRAAASSDKQEKQDILDAVAAISGCLTAIDTLKGRLDGERERCAKIAERCDEGTAPGVIAELIRVAPPIDAT